MDFEINEESVYSVSFEMNHEGNAILYPEVDELLNELVTFISNHWPKNGCVISFAMETRFYTPKNEKKNCDAKPRDNPFYRFQILTIISNKLLYTSYLISAHGLSPF